MFHHGFILGAKIRPVKISPFLTYDINRRGAPATAVKRMDHPSLPLKLIGLFLVMCAASIAVKVLLRPNTTSFMVEHAFTGDGAF